MHIFDAYAKLAETEINPTIINGRYEFQEDDEGYILKDIIEKLLPKKSDKFLDIGCGSGDISYGISKLVGSTKGTVSLIRKRSYWNFSNLKPRDPVILALCSQEAFQKSLEKAKRRVEREKKAKIREEKKAQAASL